MRIIALTGLLVCAVSLVAIRPMRIAAQAPAGQTERAMWGWQSRFVVAGRADSQGRFKITGLPSGRYLTAGVDYLETGAEGDPVLLERLRSVATTVTLTEGETTAASIKVLPY